MSTQVKVVTQDGKYGLILHKHGDSAWHAVNCKHSSFVGTADDTPLSHAEHDAGSAEVLKALKPFANAAEGVTFESLKADYVAAMSGTPQAFWHAAWRIKQDRKKANRLARTAKASAPVAVLTPAGLSDPSVLD